MAELTQEDRVALARIVTNMLDDWGIEHLMGIADALRTTFPRNASIGLLWLKQPCKRLRRRRPLDIIVEDGLSGLITVRTHLDCSFAWRESERKD